MRAARLAFAATLLSGLIGVLLAARGDHDYDEMFTTERLTTTPSTTTTLSPVLRLYEERKLRERRTQVYRRRHAPSRARLQGGRCSDGEGLEMLRFSPSENSRGFAESHVSAAGSTLLRMARKADLVFTGKVTGRALPRFRRTAIANMTAGPRRARQSHDLVPRGSVLWVRVKRVLKGDPGLLGQDAAREENDALFRVSPSSVLPLPVLLQLETLPGNGSSLRDALRPVCPQLLRVHHTAIFLASKVRPSARVRELLGDDEEWNLLPETQRAPLLRMASDPFSLTLRNLQLASAAKDRDTCLGSISSLPSLFLFLALLHMSTG